MLLRLRVWYEYSKMWSCWRQLSFFTFCKICSSCSRDRVVLPFPPGRPLGLLLAIWLAVEVAIVLSLHFASFFLLSFLFLLQKEVGLLDYGFSQLRSVALLQSWCCQTFLPCRFIRRKENWIYHDTKKKFVNYFADESFLLVSFVVVLFFILIKPGTGFLV